MWEWVLVMEVSCPKSEEGKIWLSFYFNVNISFCIFEAVHESSLHLQKLHLFKLCNEVHKSKKETNIREKLMQI